ncbi:MAG UNVERIFIED_CONTAM: DUF4062 domain-containing protein [Planctomycetaceae bacterium]|jgi:DNA-binding ferritin-like protein (Dps family)
MTKSKSKKLTVMVSSTVYGIEELLDRIFSLLTAYGYEVWMSHKGTLPVVSDRTAFENCLAAVEKCDLFLGLITPQYGSGRDRDRPELPSITHSEMRRAIELKKPRWILAHDHVVFAWSLLKNITHSGGTGREGLTLRKSQILDDLRVLELYEEAIIDEKQLPDRVCNWVQKFRTTEDGSLFVGAQFYRYQEVEDFIRENFAGGSPVDSQGGER